ncbi:MAG: tetratricopeptide repeat protein, partial [Gammaproteobacteria bacterium]|nr:tetratricopeptide repeat protein [Gammaproteobacteria bacterium]
MTAALVGALPDGHATERARTPAGDVCGAPLRAALKTAARGADIQAWRRAAQAASACHRIPEAWTAAQRWRRLEPLSLDAQQAYIVAALELYRIDEARDGFRAILSRTEIDPNRMLAELVPMLRLGGLGGALWHALEPLLDPNRLDTATLDLLAELAVDAGNFAAARRFAGAALARVPPSLEARLLLAQLDAAEGRAEEALQAAQAVAAADASRRFEAIDMLLSLERTEEAAQALLTLHDRAPHDAEIMRRLALLALQEGDYETARARFRNVIENRGNIGEAVYFLGLIAERRGDAAAALETYSRLIAAGGGLRPRARAAAILFAQRRDDEANKLLEDYAQAGGQEAIDAAVALSAVLVEVGRDAAAVAALDAALEEFPGHPALQYQRALTLAQIGRHREAIAQLERYARARPQDPNALNALGYTLADQGRQLPRAENLIRAALAISPDSAAIIDSLGWVRF